MKISASILSSNNRIESVKKLNRTNTSYIHIDVMDGKFVEDKQFSKVNEINSINIMTNKKLDIHLMVENPKYYLRKLKGMNIEFVTVHLEIDKEINSIIKTIKGKGYKVGLAIKPETDIKKVEPYLNDIDLVLVMSVEPGKGGQKFKSTTTKKIKELKKIIEDNNYNVLIEVDGGINNETIEKLSDADIAVVGSYITNNSDYYKKIQDLLNKTNSSSIIPEKITINTEIYILFMLITLLLIINYLIIFLKQ
ncbi:MAG: ribulose-phosphate 3-epimerase [Bacilli bacterium]|nr:ribulose-phosphate 3-epimerase [Bacilli bacterium]